jgi:hypothetical protein
MQQDWNIKSRSEACDATGKPFEEGETFFTSLFQEGEGFRRTDLCEEAWNARAADPEAPAFFSSWRSKFEPPAPPAPEALRRDDAEGMLRRLIESNDPAHTNTRYLLAVMLERKRILRPQPSPDKGTLIYERAGTGETFIVADPNLSLTDLVAVQEEVSAMLSGLSTPPAADTIAGESAPAEPTEDAAAEDTGGSGESAGVNGSEEGV